MKRIVLFGAGKSATVLIDWLVSECGTMGWQLTVADGQPGAAQEKVGNSFAHARGIQLNVENSEDRRQLVQSADLVISLLPPSLHYLIALDCLEFGRHLLTASYVDPRIQALHAEITKRGLLFLCEMGLDPGIDHMSAMELIHQIKANGGVIDSFRSHTGGLIAPESDDNPWHYKISWNPRNVVMAGNAGAVFKENNQQVEIPYRQLFGAARDITVPGIGKLAWYPNRDSLAYIPVYDLGQASTFIRTTLRYPVFCSHWKWIVDAGLTDDQIQVDTHGLSFDRWSAPLRSLIEKEDASLFDWLGLFDQNPVPETARTSADILQSLLENRWAMRPQDKDMIVMLHEIDYHANGKQQTLKSVLVVKGEDSIHTAMAKTVGLPLGIAAKLILTGNIKLTGLHIPILPEIYQPVLPELAKLNIRFEEEIS